MAEPNPNRTRSSRRGILARPLDTLAFLAPLILIAELAAATSESRVVASALLYRFLALFGPVGTLAPAIAVVVILLATHVASGEKWRIHWKSVLLMYPEAVGAAIPLVLLNLTTPLMSKAESPTAFLSDLGIGLSAGVYEELVFRLGVISIITIIGSDLLGIRLSHVAIAAVIISSFLFAAHHHRPLGTEPFRTASFLFRSLAGAYLGILFWFRGYGPAAGCHAAYNVAVLYLR